MSPEYSQQHVVIENPVVEEEITAQAVGVILGDTKLLDQITGNARTTLRDAISDFIDMVQRYADRLGRTLTGTDAEYFEDLKSIAGDLAAKFSEGMADVAKRDADLTETWQDDTVGADVTRSEEADKLSLKRGTGDDEYQTQGLTWALDEGIIDAKDIAWISSTIADIAIRGYKGFPTTYQGNYLLDHGSQMYIVDADYKKPVILQVIDIADTNETRMSEVKETIRNETKAYPEGISIARRAISRVFPEGYVSVYDSPGYGINGGQAGRGESGIGEGYIGQSRYSLKGSGRVSTDPTVINTDKAVRRMEDIYGKEGVKQLKSALRAAERRAENLAKDGSQRTLKQLSRKYR